MPPPFSVGEYNNRAAKVRAVMKQQGLDALMIGGNIKHDKIKELCFIAQRRRIRKRVFSFDGYGLLSPLLSFIPLIDDIARRRLTIGTFY